MPGKTPIRHCDSNRREASIRIPLYDKMPPSTGASHDSPEFNEKLGGGYVKGAKGAARLKWTGG